MEGPHLRLRDGLRVEEVGDEAVVFDAASGATVHRVTGPGVEALRLVAAGAVGDLPEHLGPAVEGLVAAGIVTDSGLWSRRRLLTTGAKGALVGGAVWGAATITTFALADPAAAATQCPGGNSPAQQKFTATGTYKPGPGVTSLVVKAWGGGGGGGGAGVSQDGGGGGGGAFASKTLTVTPCTAYAVTVGAGGAAGTTGGGVTDGGTGGNGVDSTFGSATTLKAAGGKGGGGGHYGSSGSGGAGGKASDSVGTTKWNGGNGYGGGGGGGGAGQTAAGSDGSDPHGGAGGTGNPNGHGGCLSHSGDPGEDWNGAPAGGGGGAGDYIFAPLGYYAPGAGARGEVWVGY